MYTFLTTDDLQDGTHPTDYGYEKRWHRCGGAAIQTALANNYLSRTNRHGGQRFPRIILSNRHMLVVTRITMRKHRKRPGQMMGIIYTLHRTWGGCLILLPSQATYQGINLAQLVNVCGGYRENALDELVWTRDGDGTYMFFE